MGGALYVKSVCCLCFLVQPICEQKYDASFEELDHDIEGWRGRLGYTHMHCIGMQAQCNTVVKAARDA